MKTGPANFGELISFITGYGTTYNPSKESIKLASLQALALQAKTVFSTLHAVDTTPQMEKA